MFYKASDVEVGYIMTPLLIDNSYAPDNFLHFLLDICNVHKICKEKAIL